MFKHPTLKQHLRTCLVAVTLLFCWPFLPASAEDTHIIGYWELVEQPFDLTIEFRSDGHYVALTAMGVMTGRWALVDDSHLATWSSENKPQRISEFTLEGATLTIIEPDGSFLKHRRLGAAGGQ